MGGSGNVVKSKPEHTTAVGSWRPLHIVNEIVHHINLCIVMYTVTVTITDVDSEESCIKFVFL